MYYLLHGGDSIFLYVLLVNISFLYVNFSFEFVKTIEKVIRLCTVLIFFSGSFEDMGIFHVFHHSFNGGGIISIHNR